MNAPTCLTHPQGESSRDEWSGHVMAKEDEVRGTIRDVKAT